MSSFNRNKSKSQMIDFSTDSQYEEFDVISLVHLRELIVERGFESECIHEERSYEFTLFSEDAYLKYYLKQCRLFVDTIDGTESLCYSTDWYKFWNHLCDVLATDGENWSEAEVERTTDDYVEGYKLATYLRTVTKILMYHAKP